MEPYELIPPWWVTLAAGLTVVGTGVLLYRWVARDELSRVGARVRSVFAALVFSFAIAVTGWGCWLLAALPRREAVFAVVWVFVSGYFVVAAGTFKTQMKKFDTSAGATARHLVQALLWGPIMVLMLLPPSRELPPKE
ncbi:MAG: hypothetical protein JNK82_44695 [Myxococcaceae bacterium]|nr:hypothetical protein [Myxococcaceae bacterium]